MKVTSVFLFIAVLFASGAEKDVFNLKAERVRLGRNQQGSLHIDAKGIAFRSKDGKADVTIPISTLRQADLADPRVLRFQTYAFKKRNPIERKEFVFRVQADAPIEDMARVFAARLNRPVVGHYAESARFRIPAFHRGIRGGSNGTLEIGNQAIRFVSDKAADSRTWPYRDVETIGQPDQYRFRVTTNRETYIMELKVPLPRQAYDLAWTRIYEPGG